MLYLIGGASRSGKSTLARRLLRERHVPYLPLDALCTVSHHARPGFDALGGELPEPVASPRHPIVSRSEQLWPLVRAVAEGALWVGEACGLEGDVLLPKQVAELRARHPQAEISACFLGYAAADPRDQLQALRDFPEGWGAWFRGVGDEEGLAWVAERVAFSRYLRRECARHGCAYVETAVDFSGAQAWAFRHLTRPERLRALVDAHVGAGIPILAVGLGGDRPGEVQGRPFWPVPGAGDGLPAGGDAALVAALAAGQAAGAGYLLVAAEARPWLAARPGFRRHLEEAHRLVAGPGEADGDALYELSPPGATEGGR